MTTTTNRNQVDNHSTFDVAIIGAGFAGVGMAIALRRAGIDNFVVLEQADAVGGTWRENTYPGLACDIPAMLYSFSFEQKTDWSHKFPPQSEILDYIKHCTDKYGIREHIRLNTGVEQAHFDESGGLWRVDTDNGDTLTARTLVSGTGQLNRPKLPAIDGVDTFAGPSFHSARWDHELDFRGKRVAVIGNGASAVQFIPKIAAEADRVSIFQRTANWIIPRNDRRYTGVERWLFQNVPGAAKLVRGYYYIKYELRWPIVGRTGGRLALRAFEWFTALLMRRRVADPRLHEPLTPDYTAGCKRILISDDYYAALNRDNVELVTDPIERINADGVITETAGEQVFDIIIYATGFYSHDYVSPVQVYGRDGLDLNGRAWADRAEAFHGLTLPGFPNFFLLYGPNTNLSHNSIIFMLERQIGYVTACVQRLRERHVKTLELRETAMQNWRDDCYAQLDKTIWAGFCDSWYKTADGKITNNWPYSTLTYWWRVHTPDWSDYHEDPHDAQAAHAPQSRAG